MKYSTTNMCKECGREFDCQRSLHSHLKAHKLSAQEYYHKHFPRYDLKTGELLYFKSVEDYTSKYFNTKTNEYSYLAASDYSGEAKTIIDSQMEQAVKDIGRFPSFCEWRGRKGIDYERLPYFDQVYKKWFNKGFLCAGDFKLKSIDNPNILVDTREQKPLFNTNKIAINVGDYTLGGEQYNGVNIDRKSLNDFISTFTSGLERFWREMDKAVALGIFMVVLVEYPFNLALGFQAPRYSKQKANGNMAFAGLRRTMKKYPNVQFLFVMNREDARNYVYKILSNPEIVKTYDLQYYYNIGKF